MTPRLAIRILQWALGLVVAGESLLLHFSEAHRAHDHPEGHFLLAALGLVEFLAAILFLVPKTLRLGSILLLITFAAAAAFHFLHGQYRVENLAIYGAAVLAVMAQGREA